MNYELFLKMMTWGRGEGTWVHTDTVSDNARFPNLIKSYQSILNILLISHHRQKNKSQIIPFFPEQKFLFKSKKRQPF